MRPQPYRWQFGLIELFVVTAVLAVLLGLETGTHGILRRLLTPATTVGYVALVLFLTSCFLARVRADVNLVCGALVVSWQLTLVGMVLDIEGLFIEINTSYGPYPPAVYRAVLAQIVVPLVLTAVTLGFLLAGVRGRLTWGSKTAIIATILAIVDVVLFALITVAIMTCRVRPDGTLNWWGGVW